MKGPEFVRKIIDARKDPRTAEINQQAQELHAQFNDLFGDALGHVYVLPNLEQSERILPSAINTPLSIDIAQLAGDGSIFRCGIMRTGSSEVVFVLSGNKPQLANRSVNPDAHNFLEHIRTTELSQHGADKKAKELHALAVGKHFVSTLLEIREESPEAFIYQ